MTYPIKILHWIGNKEVDSSVVNYVDKINPANGKVIAKVSIGQKSEVEKAVNQAKDAFTVWSNSSIIERADVLRRAAILIQKKKNEIAEIVSLETGKSVKDALGEVSGVTELGYFMAGEGRRFYGKTTSSAIANRIAMTIRQPIGICALIVPFNTPIANVAWKAFPALLCGNTTVLKASKDTPYTPIWFAKVLKEAGIPKGVLNVLQGSGEQTGKALIENKNTQLISFTGSVETGKFIQKTVAERLIKINLELGGKNSLVVCDDADLETAVNFAVLSAFSNAGQRCAAAGRIIVFESIYEKFKRQFLTKAKKLKVGTKDTDDLGPVINKQQLDRLLQVINDSKKIKNAKLLLGGCRLNDKKYQGGFYLAPTVFENIPLKAKISQDELFGPVTCLYKIKDFNQALDIANESYYGLTGAIHTQSIHRIQEFIKKCRVGVVSVNGATYGGEPHLPFGGLKNSGNGFREPGTEALDFYSEWKTIYIKHDPQKV